MEFDHFPFELKLKVFSYLSSSELCIASLVCKKWYKVATDPILWKRIEIFGQSSTGPTVLLNRYTLVCELKFKNMSSWSWVSQLPTEHHLLRSLEFEKCLLDKWSICELIQQFPNVESVALKSCHFLRKKIMRKITKWKKLKRFLELGSIDNSLYYNMGTLLVFFGNECQNLEEINFTACFGINNEALETFMNARKHTLKQIHIPANELTARGYNSLLLAPLIGLSLTKVSNPAELCEVLQKMTQLKKLIMHFGEDEFTLRMGYLSELFQEVTFNNLKILAIVSCINLDDVTVTLMINSCPSLQKLLLANCPECTDQGLNYIIENCRNLETLRIAHPRLKGNALTLIPEKMTKLRILHVASCGQIDREILKEVAEKIPDLRVFYPKNQQ